jgi:excisionase family DNA binding protein
MTDTAIRMVPEQDAYSVKQAGERIGKSESFIRKLIREGKLTAIGSGRTLFIRPAEIIRYLDSQEPTRP